MANRCISTASLREPGLPTNCENGCATKCSGVRKELVLDGVRRLFRPLLEQLFGFGKVRVEFQHALDFFAGLRFLAFLPENLRLI